MSFPVVFPFRVLFSLGLSLGWYQSTPREETSVRPSTPELVFQEKMASVDSASLPVVTLRMAETFLNTPYVAHTLEGNPTEQLVCRFDALDCTTLVDVAVALAFARVHHLNYPGFLAVLRNLRYKNGEIDGYASRNHYFLEWRNQALSAGLLRDITFELGGEPYAKSIDFMSAHPALYSSMDSQEVLDAIKSNERLINETVYHAIPKADVGDVESRLLDGDIIGITSTYTTVWL